MLPFKDRLSAEEKKMWVAEWRRLVWHSPRYLTIYATVAIAAVLFFVRFMPAWGIADTVATKMLFGAGELLVVYLLAEMAAYGFSRSVIEARMTKAFPKDEEA
jgi:hypothetical protein